MGKPILFLIYGYIGICCISHLFQHLRVYGNTKENVIADLIATSVIANLIATSILPTTTLIDLTLFFCNTFLVILQHFVYLTLSICGKIIFCYCDICLINTFLYFNYTLSCLLQHKQHEHFVITSKFFT